MVVDPSSVPEGGGEGNRRLERGMDGVLAYELKGVVVGLVDIVAVAAVVVKDFINGEDNPRCGHPASAPL